MGLLLATLAGLGNVLGGSLVITRRTWGPAALRLFLAIGAGFLLAVALLRMLPEALKLLPGRAMPLVVTGYLMTHVFEHVFVTHFHFGEETHAEIVGRRTNVAAIIGLGLHSLFDGVSIAAAYHLSPALGWTVFIAIALHKLPEGFTIGSISLAAGGGRRAVMASASMVGLACVVGAALVQLNTAWAGTGLALATGVTLYVAATDLVPEVNREVGRNLALTVLAGVGLYLAVAWAIARLAVH